ncbi:MAG: ABC transporter ATP-binding protein, partial [Planctomycetes bacterium]|nr:ABC transporter ATP-binding protein [Planctomycetota bacterium]
MASVTLEGVSCIFPTKGGVVRAVDDISLSVADREFVVLVGPSGCGKTTTLRLIAGLEEPSAGTIRIGDQNVDRVPPRDRDVAMVFQNYALYPHMTVFKNMAFGLKMRKVPKDQIRRKVGEVSEMLGLSHLLQRKPADLSGGEAQRVALGRAIVRRPKVF